MSRDSNKKDPYLNADLLGSFYGGKSNNETDESGYATSKKIDSIDRKHAKDGKLANQKRDVSALIYILRLSVIILLILVAFFLLYQGISLYQSRLLIEQKAQVPPAVMVEKHVAPAQFDQEDDVLFFEQQCEKWQQEVLEIRSIEGLLKRNNIELALEKCNQLLTENPANERVLRMITDIYQDMGRNVEAINSIIRLLNIDNTNDELKIRLMNAVFAHEDYQAVIQLSDWYYSASTFNPKIHRLLLDSQMELEKFEEALISADRLLKENEQNVEIYNQKILALMELERYGEAMKLFEKVYEQRYRDAAFYREYAICCVRLGQVKKSVEVLGKAVNIFGRGAVIPWLSDPVYDVQRKDTFFNTFVVRVGGEAVARNMQDVMMKRQEQTVEMPTLSLDRVQENILIKEDSKGQ